jgi:hypothetical protein
MSKPKSKTTSAKTAGAPDVITVQGPERVPLSISGLVHEVVDGNPADDAPVLSYASSLPDAEADKAPETVTVTSDRAYIRSTPEKRDNRTNVVRVVVKGEVLPVVERLDDWVQVEEGYIMSYCVE